MISHYGSTPMPPITGGRSLSPRSFTRTGIGLPCGSLSKGERTPWTYTGLPRSTSRIYERRGIFLDASGICCQRGPSLDRIHPPAYLLVQALNSNLWLAPHHDIYESSPMLSLLLLTLAPHRLLLAASTSPRGLVYRFRRVRFRPLHTPGLLPTHGMVGSTG